MNRRTVLVGILGLAAGGKAVWAGATSLAGSNWVIAGDTAPRPVKVSFAEEGKVRGSLGCNRFTGTYAQDGYKLTFGPLASTKMVCPEPQMKTEMRVSAALSATRQADIGHLKLELKDSGGKVLLSLQRRDFD